MGMYDTVIIDPQVFSKFKKPVCQFCKNEFFEDWQTKSFECIMETYYLMPGSDGEVRLFLLDPPDDKYIVEHTAKQMEKFIKKFGRPPLGPKYKKKAFLPANRKKRFLGDWPHQECLIYGVCVNCAAINKHSFIDIKIKFIDGKVDIMQQEKQDE